jgi:hypothetical protein
MQFRDSSILYNKMDILVGIILSQDHFEQLYISKHYKKIHATKHYKILWICKVLLCLLFLQYMPSVLAASRPVDFDFHPTV